MSEVRDDHRRRRRIVPVLAGWAILVTLFLLWQTLTYRGLMALAAEWQFDTFGRYYPSLTYVLLAVLLASPVLWLLRGRRDRDDGIVADPLPVPGRTFIRTVLGIAAACAAIGIVVLVVMVTLPADSGPVQRIAVGSPAAADPRTGPTELSGVVLRGRTAGLNQELLVARRTIRFAPMLSPAGGNAETVRYFVEIGADENAATLQGNGRREGVLRRGGLPGELEYLFRYAGFDVAQPYYVLYAARGGLQWPYRVAAIQLALVALICLIAAAGLHWRRERLRRRLHGAALP